jgi:hypothetical protein
MKIARDIFKCVVYVNLAVYFAFFAIMLIFQLSDEAARPLCAVLFSSYLLLLVFSTIFLFLDIRAAGKGFLVLVFGLIVGALFPEL